MVQAPIRTNLAVKRDWRSAAIVVLFLAALWTPVVGMLFGVGTFRSADENRSLAPPVKLDRGKDWFAAGDAFTSYFHDRFGFRGTLITAQAWFLVKVLGVSSSIDVVVGKDGWLFYAGDKSLDNHRGVLPFSGDELARWVQLFQTREEWLARRGIPMIVVIAPDKIDVYPEFLPPSFGKVREQTRLDVFMAAMRSASNLPVVDLRPALLSAKRRQSGLYSPTDTHWTPKGAHAGYVAILREIQKKYPDMQPIPYPDVSHAALRAGDLAMMLGLGTVWREVPAEPPWPPELRVSERADGNLLVECATGTDRRLMMLGDSFAFALVPYLARNFGQILVSRSGALKPEIIGEWRPDMVLIEMLERMLNLPPPQAGVY